VKKYLGDPTPALIRPERPLPLRERIACAIVLALLVAGAVYVSVALG
jgi:hypothetical protein